jgi:hypothetical protein
MPTTDQPKPTGKADECEVHIEACGMACTIFRGTMEVCQSVAAAAIGQPLLNESGRKIGIIEKSWVVEVEL